MEDQRQIVLRLAVAALMGLAVGIEREWSAKKLGKRPQFAGMRTFLILALLGALAVHLVLMKWPILGMILLGSACLLVIVAYAMSAFHGEPDSTTQAAALLVITAGALAGFGQLALASGITALTAFVLFEKSRMHGFVERIRSEELEAGARFAVLALVVLPILPTGPYGPGPGFRPRELWAMVLIFAGLSYAGFIARRVAGPEKGYKVAGLLGGLISSTLVTLTFARQSREDEPNAYSLGYGVVGACTIVFLRVIVLTAVFNPALALASALYLVGPFFAGILVLLFAQKRAPTEETAEAPPEKNPLRLRTALQMAVAFQIALYLVDFIAGRFGSTGFLMTSAFLGLTDIDTLTFMLIKSTGENVDTSLAGKAMAIGILANTLLKMALALIIGKGKFRPITAIGLTILSVALIISMVIF